MQIRTLSLAKGIATNAFPRLSMVELRRAGSEVDLGRYSYSVWLRHLVMLFESGLPALPEVMAELGPGKSLGVGICALLSGATKYYALDLVRYCGEPQPEVFQTIIELFKRRERIPDETEFPELQPKLSSYDFPSHILSDERLAAMLREARLNAIEQAVMVPGGCRVDGIEIRYIAPWTHSENIERESVDLLCSQFVLEHVDDVSSTYQAMSQWLKSGGAMSHVIDFQSHAMTKDWNGHWACSDRLWKLMRGKRPYMLNREPHSIHLELARKCGFEVICDLPVKDLSGVSRAALTARYKDHLTAGDLTISGALIQARKKGS